MCYKILLKARKGPWGHLELRRNPWTQPISAYHRRTIDTGSADEGKRVRRFDEETGL